MPKVLEIERACFKFVWTEEDFLCCLAQRNCRGIVAEHNDSIAGFMVYEFDKIKLRIINFAVRPVYQRQGAGAEMIERLKSKLSQQHLNEICLEVRESNLPAQLFFREQGFVAIDVLKNWYEENDELAYRMSFLRIEE